MSALFIAQPTPSGVTLTEAFNAWRAEQGLKPVAPQTLKRYVGGGAGYENGPPKKLMQFLRTIV
jgi:hypothetical protein